MIPYYVELALWMVALFLAGCLAGALAGAVVRRLVARRRGKLSGGA